MWARWGTAAAVPTMKPSRGRWSRPWASRLPRIRVSAAELGREIEPSGDHVFFLRGRHDAPMQMRPIDRPDQRQPFSRLGNDLLIEKLRPAGIIDIVEIGHE